MFRCECGREFETKHSLGSHKRFCKLNQSTNTKYICECGREFETASSLNSHARFCDKYQKKEKILKTSKYLQENGKYKCECGKEFEKALALSSHFSHCDIHHTANGTVRKVHQHEKNKVMSGWQNKTPEELKEIYNKRTKTRLTLLKEGKLKTTKGIHLSEEHKQKIREGFAINLTSSGSRPNYNTKQIEYIDKLNKENGWNLQHAENGGEKFVCGYFVDGYDEKLNIVFEYDERVHYLAPERTQLREKDKLRQQRIIDHFGCDFYRYNEYLDIFYKVN